MYHFCIIVAIFTFRITSSFAAPQARVTTATSPAPPVSTACGDIIDLANQGYVWFYASAAYDCLTSVPFQPAIATDFIQYYNDTIPFHSTLGYLKNPPPAYQQPAVDIVSALQHIKDNVDIGYYKNEYAFEVDLYSLINSANDAHLNMFAGLMNVFTFATKYSLASVSIDGHQTPKVYIASDLQDYNPDATWQPSAIITLDGENVVDYLTRFATINAVGTLEPHADWNQLMASPALDIQGLFDTFSGTAPIYPGSNLTFGLENGTVIETPWLALYNTPGDTGPLTTGGDFYNFFVLGFYPASYDPSASDDDITGESTVTIDTTTTQISTGTTSWSNVSSAYPDVADIHQANLSVTGSGVVTGYLLRDISTAVLSIPSFYQTGDGDLAFSQAIDDFISKATAHGLTKVVIDLQRNSGGDVGLAFDTFRRFFPTIDPFAGSQRRDHPLANAMGQAITSYWQQDSPLVDDYYYDLVSDEWVVTDRLSAETGDNFTSWQEYYGPITSNNDEFSRVERYDMYNPIFVYEAFGGFTPFGYSEETTNQQYQQPFAAEDIVILTDGQCSSSCNLFLEFMTHDAGVKTVVVGGKPQSGPMQAGSGSRGAIEYDADTLDYDMLIARAADNNGTLTSIIPEVRDSVYYVNFLGLGLRHQVRPNDEIPLQFQYLAANCRIYYTMDNFYNFTQLWRDAANAIWNDTSLCVEDSTGYAKTGNSTVPAPPPKPSATGLGSAILSGLGRPSIDLNIGAGPDGMSDKGAPSTKNTKARGTGGTFVCPESGKCSDGSRCTPPKFASCQNPASDSYCYSTCVVNPAGRDNCGLDASCQPVGTLDSHSNVPGYSAPAQKRICIPPSVPPVKNCPVAPSSGNNPLGLARTSVPSGSGTGLRKRMAKTGRGKRNGRSE